MFKWLNKQGVESTEGYKLQRMDRFHYNYTEGDRILSIIVEPGLQYEEISVDSRSKWESPFEGEIVTSLDRIDAIRSNISKALTFMGINHRFVAE